MGENLLAVQLRIQLTAAAVTPPAQHAARRSAGAADAAAADADVRKSLVYGENIIEKFGILGRRILSGSPHWL